MTLLRYKTTDLFSKGRAIDPVRSANSRLNAEEAQRGELYPKSFPRRLVLELTNDCNLNCVMCGRHDADFRKTYFKMDWFHRLESLLCVVEEVTLMGWGEPTIHPDFSEMLYRINHHDARIYFCTNGMTLKHLKDDIFANHVDIIAVSLDAPTAEKNTAIRRGSNFAEIIEGIRALVTEKRTRKVAYPYINFVTTLMTDTYRDFPNIVKLASELGIEEAKAVYLTAFGERMLSKTLWNRPNEVREIFSSALSLGNELGVDVKLPYIQGEDPAGDACHHICHTAWRDFFIGSDGYVRPCMSTALKFFHIDEMTDFHHMWLHPSLVDFRSSVNDTKRMHTGCCSCYQSSHANWNRETSFFQGDSTFAPKWESRT